MPPLVLFCTDPLDPRRADQAFSNEAGVVERQGIQSALIDFETLVYEGDAQAAVRRVATRSELATGIYRGWMLKPAQYAALHDALIAKNIRLINDPAAYRHLPLTGFFNRPTKFFEKGKVSWASCERSEAAQFNAQRRTLTESVTGPERLRRLCNSAGRLLTSIANLPESRARRQLA
jgi:hypothetical protein